MKRDVLYLHEPLIYMLLDQGDESFERHDDTLNMLSEVEVKSSLSSLKWSFIHFKC
jgi:hypothetical protein